MEETAVKLFCRGELKQNIEMQTQIPVLNDPIILKLAAGFNLCKPL